MSDSTTAWLDSNSALDVRYDESQCKVVLVKSRVFLDVAADSRPFSIAARDARITDVGTAFAVDLSDDALHVAVEQGEVRVDLNGSETRLAAGYSAVIAESGATQVSHSTEDNDFDWRESAQSILIPSG